MNFNDGWKFHLGDLVGAEGFDVDEGSWRDVSVPHDWSVEHPFDAQLEGCTAYLPGGIGWYRKTFQMPMEVEGSLVHLNFDGIYNHGTIYINGVHVCDHPNGYTPINIEVSKFLKEAGSNNVIAVKVDHSRYADSRWYSGSGIYRNVSMTVTDQCYIPANGVFITTPVITDSMAEVVVKVEVNSLKDVASLGTLEATILDAEGSRVARETLKVKVNKQGIETMELKVATPVLWGIDTPYLYTLILDLTTDNAIQSVSHKFGIRSFEFHPDQGFFLNGKRELIKGVCLHHDGGLVGAAVPKAVWSRRLATLREGGCNAIRTSHNPPSSEFLDLCDEMGFLVQDEFFDEWDYRKDMRLNGTLKEPDYLTESSALYFQEWAEEDLKSTIRRDFNHPSIIQWSIGNEIEWTYERTIAATGYFDAETSGNYFWTLPPYNGDKIRQRYEAATPETYDMGATAQKLSKWTKEMDISRPVVMNCILPSGSYENGVADALDVIGYSYRQVMYDYGHKRMPKLPVMGTENLGQWHEWKAVIDREHISGMFIWTGVDYMGESNGQWPVNTTGSGLIDRAGFKKPSWHMYRTLWNELPYVHIATQTEEKSVFTLEEDGHWSESTNGGWGNRLWQWHDVNDHWNYCDQTPIVVEVYTNAKLVELFLNERSLGTKNREDFEDNIMKWLVPFSAGELKAVSKDSEMMIETSKNPVTIALNISGDGTSDVRHIEGQLLDEEGKTVSHREGKVIFDVKGSWKILGVDNGSNASTQNYQSDTIVTNKGRCLMIVQKTQGNKPLQVTATLVE